MRCQVCVESFTAAAQGFSLHESSNYKNATLTFKVGVLEVENCQTKLHCSCAGDNMYFISCHVHLANNPQVQYF